MVDGLLLASVSTMERVVSITRETDQPSYKLEESQVKTLTNNASKLAKLGLSHRQTKTTLSAKPIWYRYTDKAHSEAPRTVVSFIINHAHNLTNPASLANNLHFSMCTVR